MELIIENKLYLFLALIVFILLFKVWKDLEYKDTINKKIDDDLYNKVVSNR